MITSTLEKTIAKGTNFEKYR